MTGRMDGDVIVVTGGAQGIGAAITEVASREGARVALLDRDVDRGAALSATLGDTGGDVLFVETDVTDEDAVSAAVDRVLERWGRLDGLVNNAGKNAYGDAMRMTSAEWDDVFSVDLKAAWLCAKHVLPTMTSAGHGSIVNIGSLHATITTEGMFPYAAAKSGLVGFTRSLALDMGPKGIRVNALSPGYTRTALIQESFDRLGTAAGGLAEIEALHALRRIAEPAEVAEVVVFLLSDAASFVTGANWAVDGGLGARFA